MIIVTGASGFIGSVLVGRLNELGREDIVVVDRLGTDEKWKNLRKLSFKEYIHADDLLNEQFPKKTTCIFHLGAISSTTEEDMGLLMRNNVHYSKCLFSLAAEHNIPFIYASSAATYGDGTLGYKDDHKVLKQLCPLNPYSYSKHLFDMWVLQTIKRPSLYFGLKFFNVFGPNEYHKGDMRSLIHKAFCRIKEKKRVKLFKSYREDIEHGNQKRDFIYVKDVVEIMIKLMDVKRGSGIYNLGTGKARSFCDLINATFKAMGRTTDIEYIDMPESLKNRYQYHTEADMEKLKKLLPPLSFYQLEDAVDDYVNAYLIKSDSYYPRP